MAGELDAAAEPRDYTKLIWGVIVLIAVLMLGGIALSKRGTSMHSQAEVKHILVKFDAKDPSQRQRALERITDLRKRILAGESFEKLAREFSDDPGSGARGGYLGWSDKGIFDKNFEEYVWHGKLNTLSDIVTTNFGYHLIYVMNRHLSEADQYDDTVEKEAAERAKKIEVKVPANLPQAQPAQDAQVFTPPLPPATPVPAAPATPAPAESAAPAAPATPPATPAPAQ